MVLARVVLLLGGGGRVLGGERSRGRREVFLVRGVVGASEF